MEYFTESIERALTAYRNRSAYAYFYGAKGQTLTDAVMEIR